MLQCVQKRLVLIIFLVVFARGSLVFGQTQDKYYTDLFRRWGFNAAVYYTDNLPSNQATIAQNTVIICTSSTSLNCTYNQKDGVVFNSPIVDKNYSRNILTSLRPKMENGKEIYFVPQTLLTYPKYQEVTEAYFKSLGKSARSLEDYKSKELRLFKDLQEFNQASIYFGATYLLILLFLGLLFGNTIRRLSKRLSTYTGVKLNWSSLSYSTTKYCKSGYTILRALLPILLLPYILLVTVALIRWQAVSGLTRAVKLFSQTFIPLEIYTAIIAGSRTFLAVSAFNFFMIVLIFAALVPTMIENFRVIANKTFEIRVHTGFVKWITLLVILVGTGLISFGTTNNTREPAAIVIGMLFLLIVYLEKNKIPFSTLFNKRERLVALAGVMSLLLTIVIWGGWGKNKIPPHYTYRSLFSNDKKVVTLPYIVEVRANTLFLDQHFKGNSLIFVDDYLIFHPLFAKVAEKNISDYSKNGSYIIVGNNQSDFLKKVVDKPDILDKVNSQTTSSLFTIKSFRYRDESSNKALHYEGLLTLDCSTNPKPVTISLEAVFSTINPASNKTEVGSQDYSVLDFPGCRKGLGTETYLFPFPTEFASKQNITSVAFKFSGLEEMSVEKFSVMSVNKEVPIDYFPVWSYGDGYYNLAFANYVGDNELTVYSIEPTVKLVLDPVDGQINSNLSVPINSLLKKGALKDKFLIWSNGRGTLVESVYE